MSHIGLLEVAANVHDPGFDCVLVPGRIRVPVRQFTCHPASLQTSPTLLPDSDHPFISLTYLQPEFTGGPWPGASRAPA